MLLPENICSRINRFLESTSRGPDLIKEYKPLCGQILHQNPSIIVSIRDKMLSNLKEFYADTHVLNHLNSTAYITRETLGNQAYGSDLGHTQIFTTSGSSTGEPFSYGVFRPHIEFLEDDCHYGMILKEFEIDRINPKILILKKLPYNPAHNEPLYEQKGLSNHTLHTHKSANSTRYFANLNMSQPGEWARNLLMNIGDLVPFDVIITTGPIMNILARYLLKNNVRTKLCALISQTGEYMRASDKSILINRGHADYVCDHMRCWDGGATFFTCKYDTYHVMDNICWVTKGPNGQLISSDYFNFSTPFINYWNGDLCHVSDEYLLCGCGRYYRPFKMVENRPFALKGASSLSSIRHQINLLAFKDKIDQVQFDEHRVNIYTTSHLNDQEKILLAKVLDGYEINYW